MGPYMDENTEDMSYIPIAVSNSAGWHDSKLMCDRQWQDELFQHFDIASVMVDDDGELHLITLRKDCCNLTQGEREEPVANGRPWRLPVVEKRSRGKLAAGLGTRF